MNSKTNKIFNYYPDITKEFYQNVYLDDNKHYIGFMRFRNRQDADVNAIKGLTRIYCLKIKEKNNEC